MQLDHRDRFGRDHCPDQGQADGIRSVIDVEKDTVALFYTGRIADKLRGQLVNAWVMHGGFVTVPLTKRKPDAESAFGFRIRDAGKGDAHGRVFQRTQCTAEVDGILPVAFVEGIDEAADLLMATIKIEEAGSH
ncbi:MAG TPA: hypothetical protein VK956_13605, partial [Verrucomicrobium sp.]|nr:hypothetical protein [Verrucomicrobium sp.]